MFSYVRPFFTVDVVLQNRLILECQGITTYLFKNNNFQRRFSAVQKILWPKAFDFVEFIFRTTTVQIGI